MRDTARPTICFLAVAGSATVTLGLLAQGLLERYPQARLIVLDTEAFNTRTTSKLNWTGPGELLELAPEQFGLINFTKGTSQGASMNLVFNGGQFAFDRIVRRARKLFRELRPHLIVSCNDTFFAQRAFLKAARAEGAASMLVQEGPFSIVRPKQERPGRTLKKRFARIARAAHLLPPTMPYGTYGHDLVLACSESYGRRFEAAGVAKDTIRVTGVPRFDTLEPAYTQRHGKRRVVYVFQPFVKQGRVRPEVAYPLFETLVAGLNTAYRAAPFELILRAHPRSDAQTMQRIEQMMEVPFTLSSEGALPDLLQTANCVVGHYSIGLLESIILDVPVVCVPVPLAGFTAKLEADKQDWFVRSDIHCAQTADEVRQSVLAALMSAAAPDIDISSEVGPLDGRAVARSVQAAASLIEPRLVGRNA